MAVRQERVSWWSGVEWGGVEWGLIWQRINNCLTSASNYSWEVRQLHLSNSLLLLTYLENFSVDRVCSSVSMEYAQLAADQVL